MISRQLPIGAIIQGFFRWLYVIYLLCLNSRAAPPSRKAVLGLIFNEDGRLAAAFDGSSVA